MGIKQIPIRSEEQRLEHLFQYVFYIALHNEPHAWKPAKILPKKLCIRKKN